MDDPLAPVAFYGNATAPMEVESLVVDHVPCRPVMNRFLDAVAHMMGADMMQDEDEDKDKDREVGMDMDMDMPVGRDAKLESSANKEGDGLELAAQHYFA